MKTKLILSALLSFIFCLLTAQVPKGFNYQAIARDASKNPITTPIDARFSIQSDSLGGTVFWVEEHTGLAPNEYGMFNVIIGKGTRKSGLAKFSDIDWTVNPKYIMTEINYGGWKLMGSSKLWSVPYAMVADSLGGPLSKLKVKASAGSTLDEALFEVKNKTGQTVFAVYNEGVRIYVDDGAKGPKGGFAVGGFDMEKATKKEYFIVSDDSVRVYLDDNPLTKGTKGGFAIGGYDMAKALGETYMRVTRDSTRIYVNENVTKGVKGGFSVGGFDGTKGPVTQYTLLTPDNYFIGHESGLNNTTGLYNSFFGYQAGKANTTGSNNVFMGYNAGLLNTDGRNSVFIGYQAGKKSSAYSNVFIGNNSGANNTSGEYNIFLGEISGYNNTIGGSNIFLGYETGSANKTGSDNVMIGAFCANGMDGGNANVIIGQETGDGRASGDENLLLGPWAGQEGISGNGNVMLGSMAGYGVTGDKNIIIGYSAGPGSSSSFSNKLYINNSSSSPLFYGDFTDGSEYLVVNGRLGIGTNPTSKLSISGLPGIISGSTLVYSGSNVYYLTSTRDSKTDILPLADNFDKILYAQPVSFRDINSGISGIGYIAEDFESLGLQNLLVYENGKLVSLRYDLVSLYNLEVMKKQQSKIESLEAKVDRLEAIVEQLL